MLRDHPSWRGTGVPVLVSKGPGVDTRDRLCEEPVRNQPSWSVDKDAMVLGFSSFGKLLMYEISTKGTGR
jgi:hypothetical protein